MNYLRIYREIVDAGYFDAPADSKLHRVGLKVMKRKNRQLIDKQRIHYVYPKRDPIWLSCYET